MSLYKVRTLEEFMTWFTKWAAWLSSHMTMMSTM